MGDHATDDFSHARFDIRLLKSFLAVARWRHFGKAANALNTTQPSVSQHVARLEDQLGFRLVERTKRTVAITRAGEDFLIQSRRLLTMMKKMADEGRQIANGNLGTLTIGVTSSIIYTDIPDRISSFKIDNPQIELRVHANSGDYLRDMMNNGELDAAITSISMPSPDFCSVVISRQKMGVALPKTHHLANRDFVTLQMLRNDKFIVVAREYDPEMHDTLLARFKELGTTINIAAYETPSISALVRVSLGEGVTLLGIGYRSEHRDAVRVVPIRDSKLGLARIYLIFPRQNLKATASRFVKALSAHPP
jgi:DNA-binding transcriptional LysR family regulator